MKKLLGLVAVVALFVAVAAPAKAWYWSEDKVDVDNWAVVTNLTTTKAYSGDNYVMGGRVFGFQTTGAAGATALVSNDVNSTIVGCPSCTDKVYVDNHAMVLNNTYTKAVSGDNHMMTCGGGVFQTTGASGATSVVDNLVNFTMVGTVK